MQTQVNSGTTTWNEYFDVFKEKNQGYLVDFVQNTDLQKASTEDLIKANQVARQSAIDHNTALQKQTIGAKAAAVGINLLKTALNSIAYMAITQALVTFANAIITKFAEVVNAYQNGIDKLKDLSSEIKRLESEQSSLNSELKESQERLYELQQIKMPTLFEKDEIENLKEYNKQLEMEIRLKELDLELSKQEANKTAQETYRKAQKDVIGFDDPFTDNYEWWEHVLNFVTNGVYANLKNSIENVTNEFQGNTWEQQEDYLKKAESSLSNYEVTQQALKNYQIILDNLDEYQKHIANSKTVTPEDIYNIFGENMLEKLNVDLDDFTAFLDQMEIDGYADKYLTELQDKSTTVKNQLDDYISNLSTRYQEWNTELLGLDPNDNANEERIKQLNDAIARAEKVLSYESKAKDFTDLYNDSQYSDIIAKLEALAKAGELTEDTFNSVEGIDRFKAALEEIGAEGVSAEEVVRAINKQIQEESKYANNTANSIQNLSEAYEKLYDAIDDVLSKQEKLADAFKKTRLGAKLTIQELYELIKEMPSLASYVSKEVDGYTISAEGFKAVSKENDDKIKEQIRKDLENVRNDIKLNTELLEKEKELKEKEKELQAEKERLEQELFQPINPDTGVNKDLQNQYYNIKAEYENIKAEYEEVASQCQNVTDSVEELTEYEKSLVIINDLVNESFNETALTLEGINEAFGNVKTEISSYNNDIQTIDNALKKLRDNSLLTYDEMNALVDIAPELQDSFEEQENGYNIAIDALEQLREQSYKTRNDYIDDRIATVKADIEAAKEIKKAYEDEIQKIASAGVGALSAHSAYIASLESSAAKADEKLKVLYDTINKLEGLQGNITSNDTQDDNDLSDKLQNRIDYYKTILSAAEAVKNKYSEAIDKEIDALNDGKEALRNSNDERQRELDLIEARNNLENAKKRKVYVYSEGEGFKQVTDEKAVKEAEEDLRNVVVDIQEAEIDKQIDTLKGQKDQLEENTKALIDLESEIEDAKNIAQAMNALGLNDESELLTLPDDTVEEIKNGLTEATLQKDIEDNKGNNDYIPVSMDELLQSLGAKVNAEEAFRILSGEDTQRAIYNAATKGFADALNEYTNNAASSIVNNGGTNFTNTFNIYDATDPNEVARIVNQEMTNLFTKVGNSIK